MKDFYNRKTEVRWGKFPGLYFWLEKKLLPQASHTYIVREDAVMDYQKKYPAKADHISFLPTWVDEEVFYSLNEQSRSVLRKKMIGIRISAGFTQEQMAKALKTQKSNISRLENVNSKVSPTLSTIERYAHAAGYRLEISFLPETNANITPSSS